MSFIFGRSSSANDAIIREQRAEAAKAEAKEKARQARLKYGRDLIEATFSGGTVTGPGTSKTVMVENPAKRRDLTPFERIQLDIARKKQRADGGPLNQWWRDPRAGQPAKVAKTVTTPGKTVTREGIGQDFYENYRKSLEDFYVPTVNEQFEETKSQNLFDLARKGLLRSSTATERAADLLKDKSAADAQVRSQIEGQVSGLRSDVNRAKTNAVNLLTSTEDPTTAANAALTEVNAIQSRSPQFNDLGNLFASALNAYSTYRNAQQGREYLSRIPTRSPYASSGTTYG